MVDNGYMITVTHPHGTPLGPLLRITQRMHIATIGKRRRAGADHDARFVHHLEHIFEAASRLADPPADSTISLTKIYQTVRHATIAHLVRSEEHTSELQSLMRISYAVFCLKKK